MEFLTGDSLIPPYLTFPRFLLERTNLNETAKILYVLLLDRARLSQKNEGWTDEENRVFLYFPIRDLAAALCQCQQEQSAKEKAQQQQQEFLDRVSRLKANGLQDRFLHLCTFSNDKGYNPEIQKAHDYVMHWEEMKANAMGLLIWGDVGTGKSFIAGCIANALLEQGIPVLMTNFSRILNALSGLDSQEKNQFIDSLNQYSLLILDDLGIERNSEFALEQVYHVIDSRCRSKLPLIVTTNLTLEELKHPRDQAHARIYSRVLEQCVPLKINHQDIRKSNAMQSIQRMREILDSDVGKQGTP